MKREFRNPVWKTIDRDCITCEIAVIDEEGNEAVYGAEVNKQGESDTINPDWQLLMEQYGEDKLDELTEENNKTKRELEEKEKEIRDEEKTRKQKRAQQEELFAKKLEIFEIPEIKGSKNRSAKSRIRKAKSELEAVIYAAKLIIEDESKTE